MRPRWHKALRDLAHNRSRTILVVLSIAVGVFAFGTIMATRILAFGELRSSYLAVNPASATILTEPFDDELLEAVRRVPGVAEAQGGRAAPARVLVGPQEWQDTLLYLLPDDGATTINIVRPEAGAWPPPERAVLIERSALPKLRAAVGDPITIALPGQDPRQLALAGLTHDLSLPPAVISGQAYGYVNAETLEWLGGPRGYNQLHLTVSEGRDDAAHIRAVAAAVERVVERSGRPVLNTDVPTPLQHPAEIIIPTIVLLLTVLGLLALLISGFLIINTIGAILTQQTRQIGVMKAIGARADQLAGIYLAEAAAFGGLALLVALPLAALGAAGMSRLIGSQLNLDISGFGLPPAVVAMQAAAALLVPTITALFPVRAVVRRPAREALSGETSPPPTGRDHLGRAAELLGLSRPTSLALRNTFRRRGRLARTLAALALGGAVFITVITLRSSLYTTLDESIASQRYDVEVQLGRPYRAEQIAQLALTVPGVAQVESLLRDTAIPRRADGSSGEALSLRAIPAETATFAPRMVAGRWLEPGDGRAVVLTSNYLTKEPAARLGDWVSLEVGGKTLEWQIVGFIEELIPPISPAWAYVTTGAYTGVVGGAGRSDTLRIVTTRHDVAGHQAAAQALEQRLAAAGIDLRLIHTRSEDRAILSERFNLITAILSVMAALIGTVGGLGLAGTMSINVLERTREIGVMRAIGASDRAIRQIVLSESLAIAGLAWAAGALLSLPLSYGLCVLFGVVLLNTPLIWVYGPGALLMWLGIVLLIAWLASALPARAAARLTVREVLAYE